MFNLRVAIDSRAALPGAAEFEKAGAKVVASADKTSASVNRMNSVLKSAAAQTLGAKGTAESAKSAAAKILRQDMSALSATLRGYSVEQDRVTAKLVGFTSMAGRAKNVLLGFGGAFAVSGLIASAVGSIATYEQSIKELQLVTGATGRELDLLKEKARDLGATTRYSATEAANALVLLSKAGLSAQQSVDASGGVLSLATVGGMDLSSSADIITSSLAQFRLSAEESSRVVDVMAKAANSAATEVDELALGFKFAAPISAAAGQSIEQTAATIATLSNAGIKGANAGTVLRAAISSLLQPTKEGSDALQRLGLSAKDVSPATQSFSEVLKKLNSATENLSREDKLDTFLSIFNREAGGGVLYLAEMSSGVEDLSKTLSNSSGYAAGLSKELDSSLAGAVRNFASALEEAYLQAGDGGLLSFMSNMVLTATEVVQILTGFSGKMESISPAAKTLASAIQGVVIGFSSWIAMSSVAYVLNLTKGVQSLAVSFRFLTAAMASNPIGTFAVAVSAVAGALYYFQDSVVSSGDSMITLGDYVGAFSDYVSENLVWLFKQIPQWFSDTWTILSSYVTEAFSWITDFVAKLFSGLSGNWSAWGTWIVDSIKSTINIGIGLLSGLGKSVWTIFDKLIDIVIEAIGLVVDRVKAIGLILQAPFKVDYTSLSSIKEGFGRLAKDLDEINKQSLDRFKKLGTTFKEGGTEIAENFKTSLNEDYVKDLSEIGTDWGNAIFEGLKNSSIGEGVLNLDITRNVSDLWTDVAKRAEQRASARKIASASQTSAVSISAGIPSTPSVTSSETSVIDTSRIDQMFAALEKEKSLIGKTTDERERAEKIIELENAAKEAGVKNSSDLVRRYEEELKTLQKLRAEREFDLKIKSTERQGQLSLVAPADRDRVGKLMEMKEKLTEAGFSAEETATKLRTFEASLIKTEQMEQVGRIADSVGESFASAFGSIINGSASAGEAFKSFIMSVSQIVFQEIVAKQIASLVSSVISGGFGGGGTGGIQGTVRAAYGMVTSAPTRTYGVLAYAKGGLPAPLGRSGVAILPSKGGGVRLYGSDGNLEGSLHASGTLVQRPTYFHAGDRIGLMGEAGNEHLARVLNVRGRAMTPVNIRGHSSLASVVRGNDGYAGLQLMERGGIAGSTEISSVTKNHTRKTEGNRTVNMTVVTKDVESFGKTERQLSRRLRKSL